MRSFFKYLSLMLLCIGLVSLLSYLAFFSFWFSARLFHSVSVSRACEAIAAVFLLPARLVYFCSAGLVDQSIALVDPVGYSLTNGVMLGTLIYSFMRPILFRERKTLN